MDSVQKKIFISVLFFLLIYPASLFCIDSLTEIRQLLGNAGLILPLTQAGKGEAVSFGGRVRGEFSYEMIKGESDNSILIKINSPLSSVIIKLDSLLNIVFMDTIFFIDNEKIQKVMKHDRRYLYRDEDQVELYFYEKDHIQDKKIFKYTNNSAIVEKMNILLQALLLKGIKKNFTCHLIISGMKIAINMDFTLYETEDFRSISPQFPFPTGTDKIDLNGGFYVYKMHVAGLLGLFIWTNWYLAFSRKFPYSFIAYWGGGKKDYEIYYVYSSFISKIPVPIKRFK